MYIRNFCSKKTLKRKIVIFWKEKKCYFHEVSDLSYSGNRYWYEIIHHLWSGSGFRQKVRNHADPDPQYQIKLYGSLQRRVDFILRNTFEIADLSNDTVAHLYAGHPSAEVGWNKETVLSTPATRPGISAYVWLSDCSRSRNKIPYCQRE